MVNHLFRIKKSSYVIAGILMIVYCSNVMFTTHRSSAKINSSDIDDKKFAGSEVCAGCHKDIYESFIKTAHYLDSRPAAKEFIKGSFAHGKNKLVYNQWMQVVLEEREDSFFQTAFINDVKYKSEPFDIVIGSGRKGQTYLYWQDSTLYQLPVSYYSPLNSWCNSPGFSNNFIKFDRTIPAQCLECHGSYAKVEETENNLPVYDKNKIIYGIDCERCHGPAAEHVDFYKQYPEEKTAKNIIDIKQLSRQQKLDGCALCHSGFRNAIKPAFSFMIGDTLNNYSLACYSTDSILTLDVHGNQYGLLMSSKCFKMSQLDCSSCHNPHVNEFSKTEVFSQRCITCHKEIQHTTFTIPDNKKLSLNNNCIDCHMPSLPSKKIILTVANTPKAVPDLVRTHRIAIYPEQTKEFLEKFK